MLEWGWGKGTNVQSVGRPEEGESSSGLQHQSAPSEEWEHSNKAQGMGPVDPFPAFRFTDYHISPDVTKMTFLLGMEWPFPMKSVPADIPCNSIVIL